MNNKVDENLLMNKLKLIDEPLLKLYKGNFTVTAVEEIYEIFKGAIAPNELYDANAILQFINKLIPLNFKAYFVNKNTNQINEELFNIFLRTNLISELIFDSDLKQTNSNKNIIFNGNGLEKLNNLEELTEFNHKFKFIITILIGLDKKIDTVEQYDALLDSIDGKIENETKPLKIYQKGIKGEESEIEPERNHQLECDNSIEWILKYQIKDNEILSHILADTEDYLKYAEKRYGKEDAKVITAKEIKNMCLTGDMLDRVSNIETYLKNNKDDLSKHKNSSFRDFMMRIVAFVTNKKVEEIKQQYGLFSKSEGGKYVDKMDNVLNNNNKIR